MKAWFNNNGHKTDGENELEVGAVKRGRSSMLSLGKRDRKLSRLQMYQRHYYQPKWAKQCEKEWREYNQTTEEGPGKKARITFINDLCTGFLNDETDEIKKEIDAYMARQAKGESFVDDDETAEAVGEEVDEKRQMAVNTLTTWNK